jgi:DNA-binding response OmpR family regulator
VGQAVDGQSAIDSIAADPPDAVVLDLRLPDIDGVEVCRRVRTWSDVPIIVLSANGLDERKVEALDEGANDYVTKPYSTPELLARIRAALRSSTAANATMENSRSRRRRSAYRPGAPYRGPSTGGWSTSRPRSSRSSRCSHVFPDVY